MPISISGTGKDAMPETKRTSSAPILVISEDRLRAVLQIGEDAPPETVTSKALSELLHDYNLVFEEGTLRRISEIAALWATSPRNLREMVVEGTPPIPGVDGYLRWIPEFDPDNRPAPVKTENGRINWYEQSAFTTVEPETCIAFIEPPQPGTPGVDVFGDSIAPKEGKRCSVQVDEESLYVGPGDDIHTTIGGLIDYDGKKLQIKPILEVKNDVNFSTGNIHFDGSVTIGRDVLDNFTVEATGSIEVHGLIEGAQIICHDSLFADGGMAGKDTGTLEIGEHLYARRCNGFSGDIGGNAYVRREMINTELTIFGGLDISSGTLIGGNNTICAELRAGTLGSTAGVKTYLRVGYVPDVSETLTKIYQALVMVDERLTELQQRKLDLLARIQEKNDRTASEEIEYVKITIDRLEDKKRRATEQFDALEEEFESETSGVVTVLKEIHSDTIIQMPRVTLTFVQTVKGPIRIVRSADEDQVRIEDVQGEPLVIENVARVQHHFEW